MNKSRKLLAGILTGAMMLSMAGMAYANTNDMTETPKAPTKQGIENPLADLTEEEIAGLKAEREAQKAENQAEMEAKKADMMANMSDEQIAQMEARQAEMEAKKLEVETKKDEMMAMFAEMTDEEIKAYKAENMLENKMPNQPNRENCQNLADLTEEELAELQAMREQNMGNRTPQAKANMEEKINDKQGVHGEKPTEI